MFDLGPYKRTRPAALPWLLHIPEHWRIARAKTVMSAVDVRSATGEEELLTVSSSRGVVFRSSASVSMFKAESYVGHKLCWPDDLVINSLWAWGRGLGVARDHGIVSTAYGVYRQRQQTFAPAYLDHLVRSEPFRWELQVRSQGVWKSRLQITDARWLDAPLLIPPADEQAAVVKYLAHANARIDKAVAAKRRLVALLDEQVVAEVRSVFGALGSGSGTTGVPLKYLVQVRGGMTPSRNNPRYWDGRIPWVSPKDMKNDVVTKSIESITDEALAETSIALIPEGSVLVVVRGMILARKVPVAIASDVVTINQDMKALIPHPNDLDPAFLQRTLRVREQEILSLIEVAGHGTRKLGTADLVSLRIIVPDLDRQREMCAKADARSFAARRAIQRIEHEVRLLSEFRARLVADVVTGQVDVREIAKSLPEIDEDAPSEGQLTDIAELEIDDVMEMSEV